MTDEQKTYSISLRLRRIVVEDAYVAVPVTDAIIKTNVDGQNGIDVDRFVAEAIRIGSDPKVEWKVESTSIEGHPTQGPLPDGRQCFDAFLSTPSGGDA